MKIFFFKPKKAGSKESALERPKGSETSKKHRKWLRVLLWTFSVLVVLGGITAVALFAWVAKDLPSPGKVNTRVIAESTKIYDRTGEHLLYEVHGEEKRTIIPLSQVPATVQKATISLEDQDFYSHHGIKISSIFRAIFKDIVEFSAAQGGSTITQQFVKWSLLSSEKTLVRKVKEVILSIEIEQKFSKDEILEMYLNEIPYGSNAYGIEAASQTFFGKPARELSLDEAALLAALPQAPSYYSPYGSHIDALVGRKQYALKQMMRLGYITEEEAQKAIETNTLEKIQPQKDIIAAPHFVMYIKDYLSEKYGELAIEEMGLKVYTTLDWDKQVFAEKTVLEKTQENEKRWNAENAALVAMDPKTGQILSMVGSRDYFDKSIDGNVNVAIRDRQPGSSFKPYVYLAAFEKGFTPETMLYDVETKFDTGTDKEYNPQNYDGKFRGPLRMKEALPQSLNIPAVKTLYLVGVQNAIDLAHNLGITGLNRGEGFYGLSLVLGGGEVTLLDHVHAFSTIAAGGIKRKETAILRIEDAKGNVLEEYQQDAGERVIDEKYVAMLDYVMSTNDFRAPVFGTNSPLRSDNRPIAAKTGTTNEFRDGWTIGFTPSLTVGVWAGNNDNTAMTAGADGVNVAAPIWRAYMDYALANSSIEKFPEYKPDEWLNKDEDWMKQPMLNGEFDIQKDVKVCEIPGKDKKYCLANKYCVDVKKRDFVNAHSILYFVNKDDPHGDKPKSPEDDPQYKNWEEGVKEWYKKNKDKDIINDEAPEKECSKDDFSKYLPEVSLSAPGNAGASFTIEAKADAPYGVSSLSISVDGSEIASTDGNSISKTYDASGKNGETVKITAKLKDDNGNETDVSKDVSISF